jgi:hypothetical protein
MTSGTSSSHSRIKREQLEEILVPVPNNDTELKKIKHVAHAIALATQNIYDAENIINTNFEILNTI